MLTALESNFDLPGGMVFSEIPLALGETAWPAFVGRFRFFLALEASWFSDVGSLDGH
jgi:hypothetical protein